MKIFAPSDNPQPERKITAGPVERLVNLLAFLVLMYGIILVAASWELLPETIPTHFDIMGKADGWGSKWILLAMPSLSFVLFLGLSLMTRFPHKFNYPYPITEENAAAQYKNACTLVVWIKFEVVFFFTAIMYETIDVAMGKENVLGPFVIPLLIAVLFGTITWYLVKAYRIR